MPSVHQIFLFIFFISLACGHPLTYCSISCFIFGHNMSCLANLYVFSHGVQWMECHERIKWPPFILWSLATTSQLSFYTTDWTLMCWWIIVQWVAFLSFLSSSVGLLWVDHRWTSTLFLSFGHTPDERTLCYFWCSWLFVTVQCSKLTFLFR